MDEVVLNLLLLVLDRLDLVPVLVDVELGDAADRNLEESVDVLVRDIVPELIPERLEALLHRRLDALHRLLLLDALVDALLDEDAVERTGVEELVQLLEADLLLLLGKRHQAIHVLPQNLRDAHQLRTSVVQHDRTRRQGLLA